MFKLFFSLFLCLLALIIEGSLTTLPFLVLFLVLFFIFTKNSSAFLYAFVSGIVLDGMLVRTIGETALFLLTMVFVLSLYQRKFEVNSLPFAIFSLFVSSYSYALLFVRYDSLFQAIVITVLGSCIYWLVSKMNMSRRKISRY